MATFWRRRRIRRQLRALLAPGEVLTVFERLELGGWWVVSDRALYVLGRFEDPRRVLLADVRDVQTRPQGRSTFVTVTSTTGSVVAGDVHADSDVVRRLRALPPVPPDDAPS